MILELCMDFWTSMGFKPTRAFSLSLGRWWNLACPALGNHSYGTSQKQSKATLLRQSWTHLFARSFIALGSDSVMSQKSIVRFLSQSWILSISWIIIDHQKWPRQDRCPVPFHGSNVNPAKYSYCTWLLCLLAKPADINSPAHCTRRSWICDQSKAVPGHLETSVQASMKLVASDVVAYGYIIGFCDGTLRAPVWKA